MQEQSRRDKFLRMVEEMFVDPDELDNLTEYEKAALFSAIRSEQIKRYKKWNADQELLQNADDKLNNNDHSGRRVSYLCGPDGKLLVTTATAPDYDRTNHSDGYRPSGNISVNSSKQIVLIREFESLKPSSEVSATNLVTTTTTTITTAITTVPTTIKSIFTTNVTFATTTLTNTTNCNMTTNNTTDVSYATENTIMTSKDDKQCCDNGVRLIQPNVIQRSFDSSVSEHDSTSYTNDSSSYSYSSTSNSSSSSTNTSSKTMDSSISDTLFIASNNPKSSLNIHSHNNNLKFNNRQNSITNALLLSPTPFNRKIVLDSYLNNHQFTTSTLNSTKTTITTTNYNDSSIRNGNTKKCINKDNDSNIQIQTNGHYISIITSPVQDENNNQIILRNVNNSPTTNSTLSGITKSSIQSSHIYSPENQTSYNLYPHPGAFYNVSNNSGRNDVQVKGAESKARGQFDDNQEAVIKFKSNNKYLSDNKYQETCNSDTVIVCISSHDTNTTSKDSAVMVAASPHNTNSSNNGYINTNNTQMKTTNDDYNNIDIRYSINSSINGCNNINNNNNRNYYLDLDKQSNNYKEVKNISMISKDSQILKNVLQSTVYSRPNNNFANNNNSSHNSATTISTDTMNITNQESDASIDEVLPLSLITPTITTTTNKTLKRFVLSRSPLTSPSLTSVTCSSPAPAQNYHINETTPTISPTSHILPSKTHFNRISLINTPYHNLFYKNNNRNDQLTTSFSSSTPELDKMSSSIIISSNSSSRIPNNNTKLYESQQMKHDKKQTVSPITYQQSHKAIMPNSINHNNASSTLQPISNNTNNYQSTFCKVESPPSIFPRSGFWTPDIKSSRKMHNNARQNDFKIKVYKWFESCEAARLLVDFGLPITGFSPTLSSLAFSHVPEWFHGFLSREQAERLITKTDKSGSFLLHLNESFLGYVISLFAASYCNHFLVSVIAGTHNPTKSTYQLYGVANPEQFTDLRDLVKFYSVHSLGQNNSHQLLLYPVGQENPILPDYLDIFYSKPEPNFSTRF